MRILPRILLCLIAAAASIIGMMAAAQASMFDLVSDGDFSSWGMSDVAFPFLPGEGAYADYGCFPLGNGRIFGHLGVDSDFSLLRGLTGPGYQTRGDNGDWQVWQEGNWPDIALSFKATAPKGPHQPVFHLGDKWTTQSIEQLRGAAIVRVKQSADFGELTIMQYAVPDMPVLIREYSFVPVEGRADPDWDYFLHVANEADEQEFDGLVFQQGENRLTIQSRSFRAIPGMPQCISGEMQDDGSWRCNVAYIVSKAGEPRAAVELDEAGIEELATRTREWWREFSRNSIRPISQDLYPETMKAKWIGAEQNLKLEDMIIQLPVIIETQRDRYSGSSSPMVSYHGCWVRDNNGIILTDIVNRRYDNVIRLLRYHRAACVWYGSCPMLVPLDLDLSGLAGWQPGEPGTAGDLSGIGAAGFDWSSFGVEHAEVPSLIVLQHYLLWRAMMQDGLVREATEFLNEAWGFITHNLTAMDYSTLYGVRFHGDETYTQGALYSTYDRVESGQIGWPNGYIPTDFYSFDNTILHRAAASAIKEMAQEMGLTGGVYEANRIMRELDTVIENRYIVDGRIAVAISSITGHPWLPPFSNISLRPYWLGLDYHDWPDGMLDDNLNRASSLLSGGSFMQSTPWSAYMTGHNLGYWLDAAVASERSEIDNNIGQMLVASASPEGAWCEVLGPDGVPVDIYGRINRIRPWESGINYAAIINSFRASDRRIATGKNGSEDSQIQREIPPEPPVATAPHSTQILALTRDNHFRELYPLDRRMAWVRPGKVTIWDIALPFSPDELARALMFEEGDIDYHIPFLFIDRDVRTGLDRRTMKDERFWAEIDKVLVDYEAAGGIVVTPDSIELELAEDEAVGLKLLVALYPNTFTHSMTEAEKENFRSEIAKWMDWYGEVAGDRLQFELDFLEMPHRLSPGQCNPVADNTFWMGSADVEDDLRVYGVPDNHYDAVACFWAWDRDRQMIELNGEQAKQAYGGAAQGPAPDMSFLGEAGRTAYYGSAVLKSHPDNIGNVAIHELLHNIDGMFRTAGMPEAFLNADDMAANIDLILTEQPGCFEDAGFTDDAIRELAAQEIRKEAGFPWETQLVYYEWMLRRTAREDYAQLLPYFGQRVKQEPRTELFANETVPGEGMFVAAVIVDDSIDCLIGQDLEISIGSEVFGELQDFIGLELYAEFEGEQLATRAMDDGEYILRVPLDVLKDGELSLQMGLDSATLPRNRLLTEFAFPIRKVQLRMRPRWHAGLDWLDADNTVELTISGPEGTYDWQLRTAHEPSLIEERLHEDGLLADFSYSASGSIANEGTARLSMTAADYARLRNESYELDVTYTDSDGNSGSFTHLFSGTQRLRDRLQGIDPKALPDYVIKAAWRYPIEVDAEGKVYTDRSDSFPFDLKPESSNVFSGEVDNSEDASLRVQISYDNEFLYLVADLNDDMTPGNGIWDSDRINLCIDALVDSDDRDYPDGAVGHTAWHRDDYWVFVCPFVTGGIDVMRLGGEKPSGNGIGYYGPIADSETETLHSMVSGIDVDEETGERTPRCTYEPMVWLKIPLSELPYLDATPGSFCGFTIFYSDYDEGLSEMMYFNDWGGDNGIEWRFWDTGLLYFEPLPESEEQ